VVAVVGAVVGVVGEDVPEVERRDDRPALSDDPPPHAAATTARLAPPASASRWRRVIVMARTDGSGSDVEGSGVGERGELRGGCGIALTVGVQEPRDERAHVGY
jgi:hypothetical protein